MHLDKPYPMGVVFLLQSICYFLPGIFLLKKSCLKYSLYLLMALCYCASGFAFLSAAVICTVLHKYSSLIGYSAILNIIPLLSFAVFLKSNLLLLMLAKERSYMKLIETQKSLKKSEIRFQYIVETAIEGILIFDENHNITFANTNMALTLGYTVDEMIGKSYTCFFSQSQSDIDAYQDYLIKNRDGAVYECCMKRKDGQYHWFLISVKAIMDDTGDFDGFFAMLTDINERKKMELLLEESNRQLTELSNKDGLTGIANRRFFDARLEHEYSRLKRSNSKLSIIIFDVDNFKEYNDYYGHVMGDMCLREIAKVAESSINSPVDLMARYGGEEFACILPDTDIQSAVKIAEQIRSKIHQLKIEHKKSNVSDYVTASFGVTTVKYSSERGLADIIAIADKMLYKAKECGRNVIEYSPAEELELSDLVIEEN